MNANGTVCLHLTCMCVLFCFQSDVYTTRYANVTLGAPCITDSTSYVGTGPKGKTSSNTVLRDNCISPDLYYNATSNICEKKQAIGLVCQNDLECGSVSLEVILSRTAEPHIFPCRCLHLRYLRL